MDLDRIVRRIRLRELETFIAVVHAGSMHAASGVIHLSQPAISKEMHELESALGLQLFERNRRGVQPTALGQALAVRAKIVLDEMRSAVLELEHLADPQRGELKFACTETLQAGLVAAATARLLQQFPNVRVVMELGQAPELIQHFLLERRVDFVLARPYTLPLPEGIAGEALYSDRLRVMVGAASHFAKRRRIELEELLAEHWILSRNELLQDSPVVAAFAQAGLALPQRILISGSLNARFGLLHTGRFVTMMPGSLMQFGHFPATVRALPITIPQWQIPTTILTLRGRAPSRVAERFLGIVRDIAAPLNAASLRSASRSA